MYEIISHIFNRIYTSGGLLFTGIIFFLICCKHLKKQKDVIKMKKKNSQPDMVLLKDIVIPKGTVFTTAPNKTECFGDFCEEHHHYEAIIGLSPNTSGSFCYSIDDDKKIMGKYFTTLK